MKEPIIIPCHVFGCNTVSYVYFNDFEYLQARAEEMKLYAMKKSINDLMRGHANGDHAKKCCCHCKCECK